MKLDNKEFGPEYWTPPQSLRLDDYQRWFANKMAMFVDEVASVLESNHQEHPDATINPEALERLRDSIRGGAQGDSNGNVSKEVLKRHLVTDALEEEQGDDGT